MKDRIKVLVSGFGLVFLVALAVGSTDSDEVAEEEVTAKEAEIKVSAVDLYKAYDANEVAADEKYKDKVIEISGAVAEIRKGILDEIIVDLSAGQFAQVACSMTDKHKGEASKLKKGDKITLKCKGNGKTIYPDLKGCVKL